MLLFQYRECILAPGSLQRLFELALAISDPRTIMHFRYANARMTEENRNLLNRHASEKQLRRKGIPEHVRMALNARQFEEAPQASLPDPDCGMESGIPGPK